MTPAIKIGAMVRLKPGLRNRPWQVRDGVVMAIENDKLKVRLDRFDWWVSREAEAKDATADSAVAFGAAAAPREAGPPTGLGLAGFSRRQQAGAVCRDQRL